MIHIDIADHTVVVVVVGSGVGLLLDHRLGPGIALYVDGGVVGVGIVVCGWVSFVGYF